MVSRPSTLLLQIALVFASSDVLSEAILSSIKRTNFFR
jgi:hypothetical protein